MASSLVLLLALGACGDRVDNTDLSQGAQANHPSVELNRDAQPAPVPSQAAEAHPVDTATMGAAAANPMPTEDQRIASEVKQALASDPDLGAMKIDVYSDFGMITLRGRAPDPLARDRAGDIARNVSGVKTVDNMLTLG